MLPLRVGNDVATINDVMGVIEILSSRREYTKASPFVVLLAKGSHEVTSSWTTPYGGVYQTSLGITCSNIKIIGQGTGETTILGGIGIANVQNITLKQLTFTNRYGPGIQMYGAEVALVDVSTVRCDGNGIHLYGSSSTPCQLVATRCEMSNNGGTGLCIVNSNNNIPHNVCLKNCISHHNLSNGIWISGTGVVNIHGDATALHSNGRHGIYAMSSCRIVIHLPSHHNTSYNNTIEDRRTFNGGTITNVVD